MKHNPINLITVLVVTLLVATAPVAAQQGISDLTTYTQVSLDATVNVDNPSKISFDQHEDTDFAAVYERQDYGVYEESITLSFDLNITENSGGSRFAIGLHADSAPFGGDAYNNVWGITPGDGSGNGGEIGVITGDGEREELTDIGTNNEVPVTIEYNYENALMTVTVDGDSTSYHYPAANNWTITPFISRGSGSGGTVSGYIDNWEVTKTGVTNTGENFHDYTEIDDTNDINVTKNWIGFTGAPDDQNHAVYRSIDENEKPKKLEYQLLLIESDTQYPVGMGWAKSGTDNINGPGYTGSKIRTSDGGNALGAWLDETAIGSINTGEIYYVTQYLYYHNSTIMLRVYNDSAKSNAIFDVKAYFPAGETYPVLKALASRANSDGETATGLIGQLKTNVEADAPPVQYQNLTKHTINSNRDIETTRNWVSFKSISDGSTDYVFNQSGPGTGDIQLNFSIYYSSISGAQTGMVWSQNEFSSLDDDTEERLGFSVAGGDLRIIHGTNRSNTDQTIGVDQRYYGTMVKSGDEFTLKFYTDKERTNLIESETGEFNASVSYDYFNVLHSRNDGSGSIDAGLYGLGSPSEPQFPGEPLNDGFTVLSIRLEVSNWMPHGSTQKYSVIAVTNNSGEQIVTENSTVTSTNTTVITVDDSTHKLIATSDKSINERVNITADYGTHSTWENVTVANRTIDNIEIMPPEQYPATFIGADEDQAAYGIGGEIQWVLLAILIGSMASWIARNEYLGLGIITFLIIIFWAYGTVSLGLALVAVFYGMFAGYMLRDTPSRSDTNVAGGLR